MNLLFALIILFSLLFAIINGRMPQDVYKRQVHYRGHHRNRHDIFSIDRADIPVSYTHLDVYKRQPLYLG